MKKNVSVCIIAKNEEKVIENCIKSVLPIADEIILLDTGSTDNTKELAQNISNKVKVFETIWENNFSKAKNECISYASGKWILAIDSDEVLMKEAQENLIPFLEGFNNINENISFRLKVYEERNNDKNLTIIVRPSLFLNNGDFYYTRPVHEMLTTKSGKIRKLDFPFQGIYHYVPKENIEHKREKYIQILENEIENNPDSKDNYYNYYQIGFDLIRNEKYDKAFESFCKSRKLFLGHKFNTKTNYYGSILVQIINILINNLKDYKKAFLYIKELHNIFPELPDSWYFLGLCKHNIFNYKGAIESYNISLKLSKHKNNFNIGIGSIPEILLFNIYLGLGRCNISLGKEMQGFEYLKKAEEINPNSEELIYHMIKYYTFNRQIENSIYYFNKLKSIEKSDFSENQKHGNIIKTIFEKITTKSFFNQREIEEIKLFLDKNN